MKNIKEFIRTAVAKRMRVSIDDIADDTDLLNLGLQSIDAVIISGELEEHFNIDVEPVLLFETKTVAEASRCIQELMSK